MYLEMELILFLNQFMCWVKQNIGIILSDGF